MWEFMSDIKMITVDVWHKFFILISSSSLFILSLSAPAAAETATGLIYLS